jgi:hypothetical protein
MSGLAKISPHRRIGVAAIAALTLGVMALPSAPADARVFIGVGVPAWGYAPGYYGYGYPYGYYPAYGYGFPFGGGLYFGFGGWHHHHWHHHWHH